MLQLALATCLTHHAAAGLSAVNWLPVGGLPLNLNLKVRKPQNLNLRVRKPQNLNLKVRKPQNLSL